MLRITRLNVIPPGGYQYTQAETGMFFDGNLSFKPQCYAVLTHRRANNLPRATIELVAEDVVAATCQRVPGICTDSSAKTSLAISTGVKSSSTKKCSTCGGRRAKR